MSERSPTRALTEGTQLANRYTLIRRLGTGGAADTWLASDRVANASVALKILAADDISKDAFRREWRLAIRLMHAHIVRVFEFHDEALPFYSLQFIDGPDLSILSGATPDELLPPLALVADALRYAHAKGVVHRDIKASNILLDHNGSPYLIDFGVASAQGHELVSGRSPWSSTTTEDDIRNAAPAELTAAKATAVPPALVGLVGRMLDKDAARRPDAETVATELAGMGYAAAPAPARFVAGVAAARDEIIESSEAVRPVQRQRGESQQTAAAPTSGISPRTLGISLAVLLLILLGVVFLLPKTVERDTAHPEAEAEPTPSTAGDEPKKDDQAVPFSENIDDLSGRDKRVQDRASTELVLGELLAKMETLEGRAVQRWGGLRYARGQAVYAEGDEAYLARDYATASEKYHEAIRIVEPMLDEVDAVFESTYAEARQALENADAIEAVRLFELAVAISPGHSGAQAGFERARNLDTVITLTDQGFAHEKELELEAARQSFAKAVELDPLWEPAQVGLERVLGTMNQMEFDLRMTEGLTALAEGDYLGARAAFRMSQQLKPGSREPADGLLQVEQGMRLDNIVSLENRAVSEEEGEQWAAASATYESILELDGNLAFAKEGLDRSRRMEALHSTLQKFIDDPDSLSRGSTMQSATKLLLDVTRMEDIGPRLADQRDELSRLLKRAATPLTVRLVSDGVTDVSIYKVGKLGSFDTHELSLRPGTYVAVGIRPGYRDVRQEFQVAPEIDMQPVVVRCEEQI
jgi:tetratricopeptide (TPR) repeat protein